MSAKQRGLPFSTMRALVVALAACSGTSAAPEAVDAAVGGDSGGGMYTLPPVNGGLDYQLGGAYGPPGGVTIVSRDREAAIASGLYNICYVNGFQIQPNEEAFWTSQHGELILRDGSGRPVSDPAWNEMLIDVRTPSKRAAVAAIIGDWIAGCDKAGFDAIEVDNLDSYVRSKGLLTEDQAVATMQLFSAAAHGRGMAIAQKNSSELVPRKPEMATDFAVVEECTRYAECDAYRAGYGDHVLVIEYRAQDFDAGCKGFPQLSIVLRDLALSTPGQSGYVFKGC